ncbi:DMT family transporter [Riemerella columbina]|uniref:DMT family transporter n=1 Tax=Riemerella columbina TaxID=103810 RepID=UPI00266F2599|nr:DMT family transporter [Riemerella columbina]WKS95054.1 DMT family transporter [Riemerella columbina]
MWNNTTFKLHLIVFMWGFTAILGKMISVDSLVLVFYRMGLTAICIFIFLRLIKGQSVGLPKALCIKLLGIGVVMGLHWLFFFESIKVSNVSITLSCIAMSTLFASIIEPIIYKRKLDWTEVLIGIVIMGGMALIFKTEFRYQLGIIYGIICALLGTIFSIFNGKMSQNTSAGHIILYEMIGGWIVISAIMMFNGQLSEVAHIGTRDMILILILAVIFTAYPMIESTHLMKYISPFTLILTVNLEPVYGILLAYFIFGESEHMNPMFYLGAAIMIGSIIANGMIKAKRKKNLETTTSLIE